MHSITPYPWLDLVAFASALFYGNFVLRNKHPNEVYAIWLVFSFMFCIFLPLAWYAESRPNAELVDACFSYKETCRGIYKTLTDVEEELKLVGIFVAITIAPQILAYILAGVWGTATTPQYIWVIRNAAVWSFIKFVAGLGGIFLAQTLAKVITKKPWHVDDFVPVLNYTATAFVYALWHLEIWDAWDRFYKKRFVGAGPKPWYIRRILEVHDIATRKVPKRPPPTLLRLALVELAKSDAFYNFVTRARQSE